MLGKLSWNNSLCELDWKVSSMENVTGFTGKILTWLWLFKCYTVPWQIRNDHFCKCKLLYFAFIDLEKVFDKVRRKVSQYSTQKLDVSK